MQVLETIEEQYKKEDVEKYCENLYKQLRKDIRNINFRIERVKVSDAFYGYLNSIKAIRVEKEKHLFKTIYHYKLENIDVITMDKLSGNNIGSKYYYVLENRNYEGKIELITDDETRKAKPRKIKKQKVEGQISIEEVQKEQKPVFLSEDSQIVVLSNERKELDEKQKELNLKQEELNKRETAIRSEEKLLQNSRLTFIRERQKFKMEIAEYKEKAIKLDQAIDEYNKYNKYKENNKDKLKAEIMEEIKAEFNLVKRTHYSERKENTYKSDVMNCGEEVRLPTEKPGNFDSYGAFGLHIKNLFDSKEQEFRAKIKYGSRIGEKDETNFITSMLLLRSSISKFVSMQMGYSDTRYVPLERCQEFINKLTTFISSYYKIYMFGESEGK